MPEHMPSVEWITLAIGLLGSALTALIRFIRMTDKIEGLQSDVKYLAKEVSDMKKTIPDFAALQKQIEHLLDQNERQTDMLQQLREWMLQSGFRLDGSFSDRTPTGPKGGR